MSGASYPPVILEPIASDALSGNITNPMPDAPTGTNAASVKQGFPPITMESELAGGLPPLGQDMNGFLLLLSSHLFALQAGQGYQFNASVASASAMGGGYAAGAVLEMADGTGYWLSTVNNNTSNPDTGGAGWVPLTSYGMTQVSSTGGTLALTAVQAKYPIVIVSGTLTSNLLLQLPNRLGRWLIINSTTGSFTVTTLTSAGGSTGVAIPQGGPSSPVGVYCIGDGNIYPVIAPLSVAIDQNPTPLTLAERTNVGALLARYFIQSNGLSNPAIGAVFVENIAADGALQKISLANFADQLFSSTGGSGGVCLNLGPFKLQGGPCNPAGGTVAVPFAPNFNSFVFPFATGFAGGAVQAWIVAGSLTLSGMRVGTTGGSAFWLAFGI